MAMMTVARLTGPERLNGDGWHRPELWWHTDSEWWLHILPSAPPFIISMGRGRAQRQAGLPSRCPRTTSAHGDRRCTALLSPLCRSIYLHLWPSFSLAFLCLSRWLLCHPLGEGYAEVTQWDNDSPLSTFQIRFLSFPPLPSTFFYSQSFIDFLIFTRSHASERPHIKGCWFSDLFN